MRLKSAEKQWSNNISDDDDDDRFMDNGKPYQKCQTIVFFLLQQEITEVAVIITGTKKHVLNICI